MKEKISSHKDRLEFFGRGVQLNAPTLHLPPPLSTLRSLCSLWLMVLVFSACAPAAETPPNLAATPGEAVIVTRDTYANDRFSVSYPTGWRVITSPAGAPPSVTLVAPGNCQLIEIAAAPIDPAPTAPACDQPDIRPLTRTIGQISIAGSAPAAEWEGFASAFEHIAASLKDNS